MRGTGVKCKICQADVGRFELRLWSQQNIQTWYETGMCMLCQVWALPEPGESELIAAARERTIEAAMAAAKPERPGRHRRSWWSRIRRI